MALTISQRLDAFPDIPTMHEAGITNYNASAWQAFVAPANTPAPIVARAQQGAAGSRQFARHPRPLSRTRIAAVDQHADELGAFIKSELVRWGKVVDAAGARGIE